ncbi:death-associated protein 1 [Callorhinchus milii]|uniref:Death-associated protein 1 n=2 Tax=Callorhinchus milii TaxID=7868 RepID=K4FT75_CALMI|nr:death-associated protein 1 [Callorhinchus milii]AFK10544.1 Death-associated protein 1 [Callorhinchus milii]AFM86004.1 Death-associated protein 1 [Callorhinchus milii]AFM86757.1 Death-associated protein 1 [Callorhinchus milii]AFM86775.1 Death-associated protein 1 [Callorhinchus milii]AFM89582.1 Death-associated protein 1 [Callorhinchus milii]|eukprot:gi/632945121/ref/XP_007887879.1/ PREDICTED: death-associated protein 1 [Callorhinchus milii]
MSSPPGDKVEVKGGHLPAVKAGGMRIVKKHQSAVTPPTLEKDKDIEGWENTSPKQSLRVVISGAITRGDKDFPPAAAQVAHQKPQPGVEKLPPAHCINQTIHQPRK